MNATRKGVPPGAAALAKGLSLLDMIAEANRPMGFADLLQESDLPKPTFARILKTLIAFGLVRHDKAAGEYMLGPRFLELSHRVWTHFDLQSFATPELERLSSEIGETIALCRLDGLSVQYLDERSGTGLAVKVDISRRVPLHCTAAGKVLLAFQEPSFGRALLERITLEPFTDSTLTDKAQLVSDLALTRARGYAVSFEEHLPGVNSAAVPITGPDGTPIGALAVLGPSLRLDNSRIHPAGRELIAAARRITGSIGTIAISPGPRPKTGNAAEVPDMECILPWGAQLGEAPMWHPEENRLYWVDILHPAVYRFDPASARNETCLPDKLVSAILPRSGRGLMIASQDGIEELDFETGQTTGFANPEPDMGDNRLNDAQVGPGGAIWVGSMRLDASKPSGGLYRITPNGRVDCVETGLFVSNGLGWSPDGSTFYFVDTVPGIIYAYDTEPGSGNLKNRRIFARIPENEGRPDGLTVDRNGGVWCAIWDGWCIRRYNNDGTLDRIISMPVPRPTSLCFGGPDLATLYITSARTRLPAPSLSEAPLSGGLFAFVPGEIGLPQTMFEPE